MSVIGAASAPPPRARPDGSRSISTPPMMRTHGAQQLTVLHGEVLRPLVFHCRYSRFSSFDDETESVSLHAAVLRVMRERARTDSRGAVGVLQGAC